MRNRIAFFAFAATLASSLFGVGCSDAQATDSSGDQAQTATDLGTEAQMAVDDLHRITAAGTDLETYYSDGKRFDGCWKNPAGNSIKDLKDVKLAFYCAVPLEFRLCTTPAALLADKAPDMSDEDRIKAKVDSYNSCKDSVSSTLGNPAFKFTQAIDDTYINLFVKGDAASVGLGTAKEQQAFVAKNQPQDTDRPFVVLLAAIGMSLTREGLDDLKNAALDQLKDIHDSALAPSSSATDDSETTDTTDPQAAPPSPF